MSRRGGDRNYDTLEEKAMDLQREASEYLLGTNPVQDDEATLCFVCEHKLIQHREHGPCTAVDEGRGRRCICRASHKEIREEASK